MSGDEYEYNADDGDEYEDAGGGGGGDDDYAQDDDDEENGDQGQYNDQQGNDDYQGEEYYEDEPPPEEENEAQEEPEDDSQDHQEQQEEEADDYQSYDYHDDPTLAEDEAPPASAETNYVEGDDAPAHLPIDFENMFKGALDGFGGGSIGDIMGTIENITSGSGGLTNIMASGGLAALASGLIANAAHHFLNINPDTGRIIGSIAGNLIFNMGGQHNSLSDIGKIVLDNIISGKFRRDIVPFVSPHPGMPSFNLVFQVERDKCLREQRLFEDPEFPAQDSSLYFSRRPKQQIEWLRPGQIDNDPQLIVSGQSRFDVVQGALGDCWLLAAAANLTLRDELFYRVVPPDQSFIENYAGIFHFQFWRYGHWVDVVIDDRLPTSNGELIYMHSDSVNEFWSALLEKAYAKLYGSYEALKGGSTAEALEDFTGGLIEYFEVKEVSKEQLLAVLVRGFQMGSLFGCSIDADPNVKEARMETGLVRGHAYSVTALQTVHGPHGDTLLLRIRNPWGNEQEWNGAWSDNSNEWQYISEEEKHKIEFTRRDDGEFWMAFDDFYTHFEQLENCNLGPEVMNEIAEMTGVDAAKEATAWTSFITDGGWNSRQGTAGGCRNYIDTFPNNPQYGTYLSLAHGNVENDGKCTVITAVLQKYRRELRTQGLDSLAIGFAVYELGSYGTTGRKQDSSFFEQNKPVAKNPTFINLREVTARFRLPPGNYIIVPSTYEPNEDADFLLRVYCSGDIKAQQVG